MRLIAGLLLVFSMLLAKVPVSQTISMAAKQMPLLQVFSAIEQQTGYSVTGNLKEIYKSVTITATVKDMALSAFLTLILKDLPYDFAIKSKTIFIKRKSRLGTGERPSNTGVESSPVMISGTVTGLNNQPLVGATISMKGKHITTTSDNKGNFILNNLAEGDVIVVSYVGYEPFNVTVTSSVLSSPNPLAISLVAAVTSLENVEVTVNTGYQQLPKERATGSFVSIGNERLNEQINFNVIDRLPIIASGMMFDKNTKSGSNQLLVRGIGTILGNTAPLIVLDNFPYEGDVQNINPNDIESVTILRDAAAASIWGAKAANGVIVLTSKKAKLKQKKLKIDFQSMTALQDKPDLFALDRVSSSDMIDVEEMLFKRGYYNSMITSIEKPVLSPVVELLIKRQGTTNAEEINKIENELGRLRTLDVRNDFLRYIYRPGLQLQNTLSLSTGSDVFGWNLSAGHGEQVDELNNITNRYTFLTNARIHITDRFRIDGGINISFMNLKSGRPGFGNISAYNGGLFPYAEFADSLGNALPVVKDFRLNFLENGANAGLLDWKYYPLEDYKYNTETQRNTHITLSTALEYDIAKWLKVSVNYQYQRQAGTTENLKTLESYEARNTVNSYAKKNSQTGAIEFPVPKGGILGSYNSAMQAHNLRGQLTSHWKSADHEIAGLIGSEIRSVASNDKSDNLYGYNPENLAYTLFDLTAQYTHYITGAKVFIPTGIALNQRKDHFLSSYFNGSYTFKQRYIATVSARRDASNLFGLNINDKWNPFWSAGIAWDITKEHFWKSTFIDQLKIRATYGKTGNLDPSKVALTTMQYVGPNSYTQMPYARFQNYANPELKWETVPMTNLGLDFSLLNRRITGTLEGYIKKGENLYGSTPIDYTGGIGPYVVKNAASMIGKGLDLELNTVNTTGAFRWLSHLNLSLNRDKITSYYLKNETATSYVSSINTISGRVRYPVYAMYSYQWAGLDPTDGVPLGYKDGKSSREYRQFTGSNATVNDLVYHGGIFDKI